MSNIYIYPKNDYETLESPNPYVLNMEKALSQKHIIVNKVPNKTGVLDLFYHFFDADIFFFNWIEDITVKRFGKLQSILFPLFLLLAKVFRKKIIWVLHNKYSHEKSKRKWTKFTFELMVRNSDFILTHSNAGVEFVQEQFPRYWSKVKYIIHPMEEMLPVNIHARKKYDLLIWGTIHPYKGVTDFLNFVHKTPELKNLKIIISGICPDQAERSKLDKLLTGNIYHINKFQKLEEIAKLANQSKYILFTYNSESILSSGSLMDSIRMGSFIIGPDQGTFRDLNSFSFIETYNTYEELVEILKRGKTITGREYKEIENFCYQNSWNFFSEKLFNASEGIL